MIAPSGAGCSREDGGPEAGFRRAAGPWRRRADMLSSAAAMTQPKTYGDAYFNAYRGGPYERTEPWLAQFRIVADRICADIAPRTALDAGCAKGFLVEQLRDRG